MSLSSLLLGSAGKAATTVDADLDAVFSRTKVDKPVITQQQRKSAEASSSKSTNKKITPPEEIIKAAKIAKLKASNRGGPSTFTPKSAVTSTGGKPTEKKGKNKRKAIEGASVEDVVDVPGAGAIEPSKTSKDKTTSSKKRRREAVADVNDDELSTEIPLTGEIDLSALLANEFGADSDNDNEGNEEEDSESEAELIHETQLLTSRNGGGKYSANNAMITSGAGAGAGTKARKLAKYANEAPASKDARTTFVGNVPVACATGKSTRKALVKHLLSSLPADIQPQARLDSIRFRSLQLAAPAFSADGTRDGGASSSSKPAGTAEAEEEEEEEEEMDAKAAEKADNHAKKRARRWKSGEIEPPASSKSASDKKPKFLTANQKKKIGAIKGDVHEKASTCVAYAVWDIVEDRHSSANTGKESAKGGNGNGDEGTKLTEAKQVADLIIRYANNTVFEGFTLRVDHVRSASSSSSSAGVSGKANTAAAAAGTANKEGEESTNAGSNKTKQELAIEGKTKLEEEKRTLYLGSLDFEEKEQAIRELCENLMKEERGSPPQDLDNPNVQPHWVERVRLVRDNETGLGKGFAYVMFKDRECVDEMLALDGTRVKLSKRKLRLERCKSAAAKALAAHKAAKEQVLREKAEARTKDRRAANKTPIGLRKPVVVPTRPDIGDQLKDLPKSDRKALKSSDDERLARRLAKKNSKRQEIGMIKAKEALDRRVKTAGGGGVGMKPKSAAKEGAKRKTRSRSDNLVFKKNTKKTTE